VPRVEWGRKLAQAGVASAMIDVSDGLSSDLGHICDESGVGAEIAAERIPLSKELRSAKGLRLPALAYAFPAARTTNCCSRSAAKRKSCGPCASRRRRSG